jgi:uncharacterized protein YbjT (DUF2867 family)
MIGQRALIVGATGLIGNRCLERLLADEAFAETVVLTRTPLTRKHPKLVQRVIDFERLATQDGLTGIDTAFCALGTTFKRAGSKTTFERVDYVYVKQFAELAAASGVDRFVLVSAVGASPWSPAFYGRVKGRAETAVKSLPFRTVHILRPSMLLGTRREPRFNEEILKPFTGIVTPLLVGPLSRLRPVQADRVAAMMVNLTKRDGPGIHIHYPSAADISN